MSQIEFLRQKLYKVLEAGDKEAVIKISQELDRLIVIYMQDGFATEI